jgi:hypothetical protein
MHPIFRVERDFQASGECRTKKYNVVFAIFVILLSIIEETEMNFEKRGELAG